MRFAFQVIRFLVVFVIMTPLLLISHKAEAYSDFFVILIITFIILPKTRDAYGMMGSSEYTIGQKILTFIAIITSGIIAGKYLTK